VNVVEHLLSFQCQQASGAVQIVSRLIQKFVVLVVFLEGDLVHNVVL
jgi:hypothetical protein